jgi:CRISPR-associated protein Cas2
MSRRRWLVAYDIREEKRLRRVHDIVRCYGDTLQYSVFVCDMDNIEKFSLMTELRAVINHAADSVAFIDLGEPGRVNSSAIEFMGVAPLLPDGGPMII